ncbi:MAG: hypothetical protein ACI867_002159 [Glaciecola sp.]|jgi:hypothetical protein
MALLAAFVAGACTGGSPASVPATIGSASVLDASPMPSATRAAPPLAPSPSSSVLQESEPVPVVAGFDAGLAYEFAVALAQQGGRDAGTRGDQIARAMISMQLRDAGWQVVEEFVALPQGGSTRNIVAFRQAADLLRPHVVIGGHYDTKGGSPGANDNGSGIGVLVSVAREIHDEPGPVPIVLVAFGAEETQPTAARDHHLGSTAYARERGQQVIAALIIDMVGNGDRTCICWFDAGPRTLVDRLQAVATAAGLGGYREERRGDISDHGPFARQGIPAAFLWTFNDGVLHTPRDTPDRLRPADMARAGALTLALVRGLGADDLEGFRTAP